MYKIYSTGHNATNNDYQITDVLLIFSLFV